MKNHKDKIIVAMSGGVDSSVAAALLKKQGYDVVGVFMRLKPRIGADVKSADKRGAASDEKAARRLAEKLGIKFLVWDFRREFKKQVVDYFLAELAVCRTPNPCVVCNPEIKFGLFLDRAKKLGADFVATGHYARVVVIARSETTKQSGGNITGLLRPAFGGARNDMFKLFSAKDETKDQSYFLYGLNQAQLSKIIFPLGDYTKDEVYKLAKRWRLPHQARQSFDICFVADYREFLERYLKLKPGEIVSVSVIPAPHPPPRRGRQVRGKLEAGIRGSGSRVKPGMTKEIILGTHQGLPFYTIGQKAGLGGPGPFYVVKKDVKKNILYVSNNEKDLYGKEMVVGDVNWISGRAPKMPFRCGFKIRYHSEISYGLIRTNMSIKNLKVLFDRPQRAITPGQSAVFYGRSGEVLGGGIIL